jgi:DNA-binding PadR family transcriptional regulator
MAGRTDVLELAVLGLLHEAPMHGYELRRRLSTALGPFRALSYGTLYPTLRRLAANGFVTASDASGGSGPAGDATDSPGATRSVGRRARVVYELTSAGRHRFQTLVHDAGPASWEDDSFDVRLAFFSRTAAEVRLRVLEGRRTRLEERLAHVSGSLARSRERADQYTLALQRHGLESVQREVRWLGELISAERSRPAEAQLPEAPPPAQPSTEQPRTT